MPSAPALGRFKPHPWPWSSTLIDPRWRDVARHLVAGVILWNRQPLVYPRQVPAVLDAADGGTDPTFPTTARGLGVRYAGLNTPFFRTDFEPLAGLESWTIFSAFMADDDLTGQSNQNLGWGRWQPDNALLNRLASSTQIRCLATLSGTNADLTINHGFTNGEYNSLTWRLDRGVLQGAPNGEWDASTDTGSGTQEGSNLDFFGTGATGDSTQRNMVRGVPLCAYAFDAPLPDPIARELHADPFALFRRRGRTVITVAGDANLDPDDLVVETQIDATSLVDPTLSPDDLTVVTAIDETSFIVPLEPDDLVVETDVESTGLSLSPDDLVVFTSIDSISFRRPVDDDAQSELDKDTGVAVTHVLEIHYEEAGTDKVLRLTTASRDIDVTVGGSEQTFSATPTNVLRIGTVEVSSDMAAQGVELTLGGVDRTFISLVMADDVHFRGRLVKMWRVYLDPDTGTVSAVVPDSDNGWLFHINDRIEFNEDWGGRGEPGTVTVTTRIVSRLAVLQQPTPVMTNVDSHNEMLERAGVLTPGGSRDEFFRRLPPLIGKRFRWGDSYPDV